MKSKLANKSNNFINVFGPGILFAGAAIGTSHLVQSTRAGASFGLGLLLIVIFANVIKYPFFRFGPLYTAATGKSILSGYKDLGGWAVVMLIVTELPVNIIIVAATALVTAAIALSVFDLALGVTNVAVALIFIAMILISVGGYKFIDRCVKFFVAVLTVGTVTATILTLPSVNFAFDNFIPPEMDALTIAFVLALLGFMPAGVSLSIMHSVWSVEKAKATGYRPKVAEVMTDLNIGYIGSAVLAVCFLIMGAGTMHGNGVELSSNAGAFAGQIISLYSSKLGVWAGFVVGLSVFAVMISTLLTILDGFSRMHEGAINQLLNSNDGTHSDDVAEKSLHRLMMVVIGALACLVLAVFMTNFKSFIDFVTIAAFVLGPVIAILNHIVMHAKAIPTSLKPSLLMTIWSLTGIVFLILLTCFYLLSKYGVF